jgi:hypothetical protein
MAIIEYFTQCVELGTKGKAEKINMMLEANVPECNKFDIFSITIFITRRSTKFFMQINYKHSLKSH